MSNFTVNNGNIVTGGDISSSTVGKGLKIKEGTNATMGTATLSGGAQTIATTAVTTSSRIFLTTQSLGGTAGALYVSSVTGGSGFNVTSTSVLDTSTFAWMIVEPAA